MGEWLELPVSEEELNDCMRRIGIDGEEYEEYFITDYETDVDGLEIGEYSNLENLNDLAELLESLTEYDLKKVSSIIEWQGLELSEAIENLDNYNLNESVTNDEELGEYWLFESGCYEIPENLVPYIDCEKFGRELAMNGNGFMSNNGWIEEY